SCEGTCELRACDPSKPETALCARACSLCVSEPSVPSSGQNRPQEIGDGMGARTRSCESARTRWSRGLGDRSRRRHLTGRWLNRVTDVVTHSRNQEVTGGHHRTRRRTKSGTGGHWRTRQDTGGHDLRRVRDREAPGSNPGPPTNPYARVERNAL